ncbi:MAG TPA: DUF4384 domain-containing protein [Polyangiales bacterium]|nr:DUF4384 domain-containing protein [Polyangiales bacterium]
MRLSHCPSALALEAFANGELEASLHEHTRAHVAECDRCRARHAQQERERAEFYATAPTFEAHAQRFIPAKPRRRVVAGVVVALAAAAAAAAAATLLAVVGRPSENRLKGSPTIGFYVKRGDRVRESDGMSSLRPGDLLRFTYSSDRERYFALFDRDQRAASVFYPPGERAILLRPGRDVPLQFSVELDDTPGVESVHALFCAESFELEPLRAALQQAGRVPVPAGCQTDTRTLQREAAK